MKETEDIVIAEIDDRKRNKYSISKSKQVKGAVVLLFAHLQLSLVHLLG